MPGKAPSGPRCAAIVGPYLSGKTTLMEALLFTAEAIPRRGSVKDGNTVGDNSPEARNRHMSVEISPGTCEFLGERWTFLDCPGSVEFAQDARAALMVADVAVVVTDPEPSRARAVAPLFRFLEQHDIPFMVFINKMDTATTPLSEIIEALQAGTTRPLVLRHVPIQKGEGVAGYIDLVSERAYAYKPGAPSALVQIPDEMADVNLEARQEMLETLADYDDSLLEKLLEDVVPPKAEIYEHLTQDLRDNNVAPVFIGAAEQASGVLRLMKALRHETPDAAATLARLDPPSGEPLVQIFKCYHMPHAGKVALSRVWRGAVKDGMTFGTMRVSGLFRLMGHSQHKLAEVSAGEVVALGRMEDAGAGQVLTAAGVQPLAPGAAMAWPAPLTPLYAIAVSPEKREDEVKLSASIQKIIDEDSSISVEHNPDTHQMLLWGQGDIHLQVAVEKLKSRFNVAVETGRPRVPYKETIRRPVQQHARHKKQSGGHGEFGDVYVEIKPLPRGSGFAFTESIHGGSVPRNYIPAVEAGVREYLREGPLGFPVVDVSVNLFDGQSHSVDSSDMAFRKAGMQAMKEGMPACGPILLEPVCKVKISVPSDATSKLQGTITKRRGQILGFAPKEGWQHWEELDAFIPQAELHDLVIELRSLSQGVGTFDWAYDHLSELTGREADAVVEQRRA